MLPLWEQHHALYVSSLSSDSWTFGWSALATIGGFLAAGATVWAVLASLHSAKLGREAAEHALRQQLAASENARRREHNIEILLRLVETSANLRSGTNSERSRDMEMGAALTRSLMSSVRLSWCRAYFLDDLSDLPEGQPDRAADTLGMVLQELGEAIEFQHVD